LVRGKFCMTFIVNLWEYFLIKETL
jgi:hypothetical protein